MFKVWGGWIFDKFLIENCGLMNKFLLGDFVMVDWGFIIYDIVVLKRVEFVILVFIKGKS